MGRICTSRTLFTALIVLLAGCLATSNPMPCQRDADCADGVCRMIAGANAAPLDQAPLGCQVQDLGAGSKSPCDTSSDCARGLCLVAGSCAAPCESDDDCDRNDRCHEGFVRSEANPLRARVCVPRTQASDNVEVTSQVLAQSLSSGMNRVTLSGTSRPALYVIEHLDDHFWPFSGECRPPLCAVRLSTRQTEPESLFEENRIITTRSTPIANWPYAFPLTVYVGNSIDAVYHANGYDLAVIAEVAGHARITQLVQVGENQAVLDLNLFYAGARNLAPEPNGLPKPLASALDVVSSIYAQAGIVVGSIHEVAIPKALLARGNTFENVDDPRAGFAVLHRGYGVWPELPALLSLSAGVPNNGVNIFFVSDIEGMGDGEVQALAGGTPGPMGMQGTGASGIAIATDMLLDDPNKLGRTIAHEMAHYLGLFHTSEADGSVLDPLADTPECTLMQDANNDGQLSLDECTNNGTDNLMFWAVGAGNTLTQDQITILRRAWLLR